MPVPTFTGLGPKPEYNDIVNKINTLVAELTNLMLNMDSLNVVELIADHISAGTITGSTIQSTDGAFPRIELSSTSNILSAEGSATTSISIHADLSGTPTLRFIDGSDVALVLLSTGVFGITTLNNADVTISPTGNTNIFAGTGKQVVFEDWDKIFSSGDSQTLQAALNAKANGSGVSGTVYVASTSGGSPTTPITFTNGVRTS